MKISKLLVILLAILIGANLQAQSPQSINYQAVVRDANGVVVMNRVVSFRLSILTGGSTGTPQYVETHSATTNTFGLVTLNIGLGTPTTGTMSAVTWATGSKFLRVEVDINGGSAFTTLGTTQFLSVPYALYAATSGSGGASGWGLSGNTATSTNYVGTNNAEDLRFYTEGSQKMVVKTTGSVGIGTNTPEARLSIEGSANGTSAIEDRTFLSLNNTSTSFAAQATIKITSGGSPNATTLSHVSPTYSVYPNYGNFGQLSSSGSGLIIQAPIGVIKFQAGLAQSGVSDRMIITNAGNVGIGTNTPNTKLHIEANEDGFGNSERVFLRLKNNSTSSASVVSQTLQSGAKETFTNISHHSSSYTVSENLDDMGQIWSSGKGLVLRASPASAGLDYQGSIRFYTGWNSNGTFASNERMRIEANGNIGIGTTTPKAKLEVTNGDVYVNDATKGIILKSPNGGCWRVTVDNTGNFVRTSITCPN